MEIDLSRLQANAYNPRTTMDKKGLASLEKSLERDGQLQTILVRPIDGGKYEVVAGMRRFLSLKSLGEKKAMCTVMEMDDQTAMQRAFKENVEREPLSPVDEANWFFKMLGLKEEQLFVTAPGMKPDAVLPLGESRPLPSTDHPAVKNLATEINVERNIIERRLPLLSLPDSMQRQVGQNIEIKKAEALARLRLIGDKKEAQEQMQAIWRQWGSKDLEALNEQVNIVLENMRKKSDQIEKELKTTEDNLKRRIKNQNEQVSNVKAWLNSKNDKGLLAQLPKSVTEELEISTEIENADDAYEILDDVITALTRSKVLDESVRDLKEHVDFLYKGQEHLHENECAFCGTKVDSAKLKEKIKETQEDIHEGEEGIKKKNNLRNRTEEIQRTLGDVQREYSSVKSKFEASLKALVDAKKMTKAEADERRKVIAEG